MYTPPGVYFNIPINVTDIVLVYIKKRIYRQLKHFTEIGYVAKK